MSEIDRLDARSSRDIQVSPRPQFGVRIVAASVDHQVSEKHFERAPLRVVESAARAANACLAAAGWPREDVEMLIHTGIYRDEFLSEPAVAAILAGELGINHERPRGSAKRTLALDLADSGRGTMTALGVLTNMIRFGSIARALVTASEIENNPPNLAQRGIAKIGSAIALERTADPAMGLGNFSFYSYPQHAERLATWTTLRDGRPQLMVHRDDDLEELMLECIADSVSQHLAKRRKSIVDFDRLLVSTPSSQYGEKLASRLKAESTGIITSGNSGGTDPFTSGIALIWSEAVTAPAPIAGESWLIVSAGAGIEVACAEYRFPLEAPVIGKEPST